jgi:transcriptional regulator with XRE-family HTH domain
MSQNPGAAIRSHRKAHGIPLEQFAQVIGTSGANLSRIENGHQNVSADGPTAMLPKLVGQGIPAQLLRPDLLRLFNGHAPAPKKRSRRTRRKG